MRQSMTPRQQYKRYYQALRDGWELIPETQPFGLSEMICRCAIESFEAKCWSRFSGWKDMQRQIDFNHIRYELIVDGAMG